MKEEMEKKKKSHNMLYLILALVVLIGLGVWYYFYWESNTYFTTENAKVTAELHNIVPAGSGKLVKLRIAQGSAVAADEVVGRVENGPYLKSPVDGEVIKCDVVLNQLVSPTSVVAVVADTSQLYVGANIEETDIGKIKEGQEVAVGLDAYPGKTFTGHVSKIDSVTQTALSGNAMSYSTSGTYTKVTQLIPVRVTLDSDVNLIDIIGTNATVKIKVR